MYDLTRRATLVLGAAALAGHAGAQTIPRRDVPAPNLTPEQGASLRIIRPARFVEPDEVIFRRNAQAFAERFKVPVRVDFVGWEDIRPQTAVTANTGTGPDVVIGWSDDPHIYADKLVELSDVAEYLGNRYGGWTFLAQKYGRKDRSETSAVKEAGFDGIPEDHEGFLNLCQAMKRNNKPVGFALGNAVGDGNAFAQWLVWSHGGMLVDEDGKVAINSRETVDALNWDCRNFRVWGRTMLLKEPSYAAPQTACDPG
jgi:multiple sugar transport system substrate-binding protein